MPSIEGGQYKTVQIKLIIPGDMMPTIGVKIASDGYASAENSLAMLSRVGAAN